MEYPYSNEYMTYDKEEHKYILTNKAVMDYLGLDLIGQLNNVNSVAEQNKVNWFLYKISDLIYSYIYKFSDRNDIQEYILAKCPSARNIVFKAMLEQVEYMRVNGELATYSGVNLTKGTVMPSFKNRFVCEMAKDKLNTIISETGMPITYNGFYSTFKSFSYEQDNY